MIQDQLVASGQFECSQIVDGKVYTCTTTAMEAMMVRMLDIAPGKPVIVFASYDQTKLFEYWHGALQAAGIQVRIILDY